MSIDYPQLHRPSDTYGYVRAPALCTIYPRHTVHTYVCTRIRVHASASALRYLSIRNYCLLPCRIRVCVAHQHNYIAFLKRYRHNI